MYVGELSESPQKIHIDALLHILIHAYTRFILFSFNTVALNLDNEGCNKLKTEAACVASADGRPPKDSFKMFRSPCHWCCNATCTNNTARCEPQDWLAKQQSYKGKSRNGVGYDSCPAAGRYEIATIDCNSLSFPQQLYIYIYIRK